MGRGAPVAEPARTLADICRDGYYLSVSGIAEQNEAHQRFGAVYFTGLRVAEVRCFGPEQRLSLADRDRDRAAKWTVILGENGVGKTTLLQCVCAMAPYVSEARPGARARAFPRGSPSRSLPLWRAATSSMSIRADVVLDELLTSPKVGAPASASIESEASRSDGFANQTRIVTNTSYPGGANVVCCGYGALRRSAEASVEAGASDHSAASLFSDDAALISGSEWLLRADYAAQTTPDARATIRRDKIRAALIDLLPDVNDIRVAGLDEEPPRPRIDVETPYGWVTMRAPV